jgi:hypothetical protein
MKRAPVFEGYLYCDEVSEIICKIGWEICVDGKRVVRFFEREGLTRAGTGER